MPNTCFGESSNKHLSKSVLEPAVVYKPIETLALLMVFGTQTKSLGYNCGDLVVPSGSFDFFG